MFTDIVGYTRMTQANERAALELLEEHRGVLRPIISSYGGVEVKTIGDAFLVEFKSALEAVTCGVEMQRRLGERNSALPEPRRVQIRIGIHLGDVVHASGDVYGDAVNVASRIEPLAEPGGICITQQVYHSVRNKSEVSFVEIGKVELKNVDLPMTLYRVDMESRGPGPMSKAPRERLAVLPFVNISPDPNDEYFADGLTEELITKLSEIKGLKVIARTSVMNYKKKEKSISAIGRELEVGSIIEGSVRKAGTRIRVTVQLIDSSTEEHLWAQNYDKELDDIFAIQSDVASKVAGSVSTGLLQSSIQEKPIDVEAYTLYIKGTQLAHEGTEPELREAVSLLEKAVAKDNGFTRAYAALGNVWATLATGGYEDFGVVEAKAEPMIKKALQLEPDSAEANAAMARVCYVLDRFDQIRIYGERALRTNPNLAETYVALGVEASSMLRLQEGLGLLERAHELDPLETYNADLLARVARVAGENDKAIAVLQKMDRLSPSNPRTLGGLGESYMLAGDYERAQEYLKRAAEANPGEPLVMINQGLLYALTGRRAEAETVLDRILRDKTGAVRNYGRLFISTALGRFDDAFEALNMAADMHSWPFLIASLPIFGTLRRDPRYAEFAKRVGLPPPVFTSA